MKSTNSKQLLIGLTGTIGCGKSFVADIMGELGGAIIDTDIIAREVVAPGSKGLSAIVNRWGEDVLHEDVALDREAVADIVFKDEKERNWLNGLLHPIIMQETARRIAAAGPGVVVLVVPLLFESGMDAMVKESWVVTAPDKVLIERIIARDNCSREHAESRIRSQMSQEDKIARADVVIDNGGDRENTRRLVEEAWKKIEIN